MKAQHIRILDRRAHPVRFLDATFLVAWSFLRASLRPKPLTTQLQIRRVPIVDGGIGDNVCTLIHLLGYCMSEGVLSS